MSEAPSDHELDDDRWVGIAEAARISGRHTNTIRNWIRQGRIQYLEEPYPGGTRYLVRAEDVVVVYGPRVGADLLPSNQAEWEQLIAQIQSLAHLARELPVIQQGLYEAHEEIDRLVEENRELRRRLDQVGEGS